MISCVMSIYGFYSTNLVLRRLETSAAFFYPAIHVYNQNIQWALMAATSPPQKCAMMAFGVRSR